ncbi:hypothetical protein SAMN05216223_107262 [Actinacidiphila yanglinensis]|uniref:Uncharacterized protein n=1 Tax=Actinacidiphila yanglinensis TaxID=310779 RepID=A0A1H6BWC2_9ACTN|nr:hypothetical protein [Actinacidiphila yanglinensis]SEG64466.1 hypothetical protein SAMN05216223_107262 [Actinacidiphila yanglinensis]
MHPDTTTPSTPEPPRRHLRLTDSEAAAQARQIIADAYRPVPQVPTSYRDTAPLPTYGTTPPVAQPDTRVVPGWAAGTAVAGIGVGSACVGVGCGIWLACQGFSAVTLTSVLFVTLPIAALASVVAAIAAAARSFKATHNETHHHYAGPVTQQTTSQTSHTRGLIAHTRNDLRH